MASVKLGSKAVGSIVKLKENGSPVEFYVAKHDYESGLNGAGRTLLVRTESTGRVAWNSSGINAYANGDLDTWFNGTYKARLDPSIQAAMATTTFYYVVSGYNPQKTTLARSVFALSREELGFTLAVQGNTALGTELPTAKQILGCSKDCWTRSTRTSINGTAITGTAYLINSSGAETRDPVSKIAGALPALTLPSRLSVGNDGLIFENTAPSVPPSIDVPAQINGGSTVTISWGTASDSEDNLEGYKVERSTDGGSTWSQIYQGGGTSTANIVPFGTETVMYRVKAYDAEGLESAYRTSGQVSVTNNTAPTVPGGITVPEAVQGGQPLTVS